MVVCTLSWVENEMAHIGLAAMSSRRWDLQKTTERLSLEKADARLMQFVLHEFLSKIILDTSNSNHSPTCFCTLVCLAGGCGGRLWRGLSED